MTRFSRAQKLFRFFRSRENRLRDDLTSILNSFRRNASLEYESSCVLRLVEWMQLPVAAFNPMDELYGRLIFFLEAVKRSPQGPVVSAVLVDYLAKTSIVSLLTEAGLRRENSLLKEIVERFLLRTIPRPFSASEVSQFLYFGFGTERSALWVAHMPMPLFQKLFEFLSENTPEGEISKMKAHLESQFKTSIHILAAEIQALALSPAIRLRTPHFDMRSSPFVNLATSASELLHVPSGGLASALLDSLEKQLENCRFTVTAIYNNLNSSGISVDLVYRLEKIAQTIERIGLCVRVINKGDSLQPVQVLLKELCAAQLHDKSIRALLRDNLNQLSRRIVERTGDTGEHYITSSRKEYFSMLRGAAGGGALTTFTAVMKSTLGALHLPLFFDGLASALNYSSSFVFMHFVGFKLATKQPSMTASSLAKRLSLQQSDFEHTAFMEMVARITRSQFASVVGNLGATIPVTALFHLLYIQFSKHNFYDAQKAAATIASFSPFTSLTIVFAAYTGFLLWLSSLAAGWIENWVVHRQVPDALATHPKLVSLFGRKLTRKLGRWFEHNVAGVWSSIILGFLLAFSPIIGQIFGVPLDSRHVTLSTASLTLAASSAPGSILSLPFLNACLGIVAIGCLNFGVSFLIALFIALRARGISFRGLNKLAAAFFREFRTSPTKFLLPPP